MSPLCLLYEYRTVVDYAACVSCLMRRTLSIVVDIIIIVDYIRFSKKVFFKTCRSLSLFDLCFNVFPL